MARRNLVRDPDGIYHVMSRTNNQTWFELPLSEVWCVFGRKLGELSLRHGVRLHLFVLMSNHYHLMLSDPGGNLDVFMRELMTAVSKSIGRAADRINHVFGGRYKWSLLQSPLAVSIVYKYVCRNPVKAGMCSRVEEYPYSTLSRLLTGRCDIPLVDRTDEYWDFARVSIPELLNWLNQPAPSEQDEVIRQGLRRFQFQLSKSNSVRKLVTEVEESYAFCGRDRYLPGPEVE